MRMPERLPQWNAVGVEPPQSLKDSGWQPGMKPSAQHMNWLLNRAYKCIEELQQTGGNVDDLTQAVADLERKVDSKFMEIDEQFTAVDTALKVHEKAVDHTFYVGGVDGANAKIVKSNKVPLDTSVNPPKPITGCGIKFFNNSGNTGNVTVSIQNENGTTSYFPVVNMDYSEIQSGQMRAGAMVTIVFNGTTFFLQGSESGVKVQRGKLELTTPGTHSFTVPKGVSKLTAYIFGAGGGGGGCSTNEYYGGGGGGAGAFMLASIDVTQDEVLSLTVGAGGFGPAGANNGQPGGMSGITIRGLQYQAGGGGGGTYASGTGSYPWGNGGQGGMWSKTGTTGLVGLNDTPNNGSIYTFASAAPSNFLLSYSGGSGDCGKTPNYGGGGGGGPSDAQGGFAANTYTPGSEPNAYCNVKGQKGGSGDYKGSGNNGGLASGGGGSSSTVGKAGDGGNGKIILHW